MAPASSSSTPLPPSADRTPDVASFLGQLAAGPSSSSTLPFEAQASLISTQLSNVETQTAALVQQRRGDLAKLIDQSEVAEQRLDTLVGRIEEVEHSTLGDGKAQLLSPALGSALQQYSNCLYTVHRSDHLLQALQVVHTALYAIEALEDQVAQGRLEADAYAETLAQTEAAYAGLLTGGPSSSSNGSTSLAWLAESGSSRAVADLLERRKYAKAAAEAMIERGWEQSVKVGKQPAEDGSWKLSILEATHLIEQGEHSVPLHSLAQSLFTNGSLDGKLSSLAESVISMLSATFLSPISSERWAATLDPSSQNQALLLGRAAGKAEVDSLETILEFIGSRLLPALDGRFAAHFSRALLPALIPLVLTKLRSMLPSSLQAAEGGSIPKDLALLKSSAERVYSSLEKSGLIPAHLDEDSEEAELLGSPHALLRFASSVHTEFSNKVAASARDQARRLCMAEDETGWDTEQIEIEESLPLLENDEEWAVEELLNQGGGPTATQNKGAANGDDWGWGEAEEEIDVAPAPASAPTNMVRSASMRSSTSSADGSSSYSRSSSPAGQRPGRSLPVKKGRGALGGVRVIKPSDQMGSGPLPGDEDGDDAWGLDDDLAEEPPRTPVVRHPDVADAWGLDEEAAEDPNQVPTTDARRSLDVAIPADDADDAWFTEEVDADTLPSVPTTSVPMAASTSMPSTASYPSVDDLDEDAWGLSEEEKAERAAKRASMMSIPIGFKIPTEELAAPSKEASVVLKAVTEQASEQEKSTENALPSTRGLGDPQPLAEAGPSSSIPMQVSRSQDTSFSFDDEDELDEDAWGLSAEEQKERAEKRASRRLTLGQQFNGLSFLQTPPATNEEFAKTDTGVVPEPVPSLKSDTSEGDALTADNLEASGVEHGQDGGEVHDAAERQGRLSAGLTPAGSIDVAPSEAHLSDLDSLHDHLPVDGSKGIQAAQEVLDNVSVVSHASANQPFPLESALPQDLSSRASEAGSEAVLPATPQSERSEPTIGDDAAWEPETMSLHEGSIDGDRGGEGKTLFQVESALPISSASSVATGSAGPPSVGSLRPTPKAEADLSLADENLPTFAGLSSTPPVRGYSSSSSVMAMDSRPRTPLSAEHQGSEPPFPVHSAFPYHGTLRGSVMGTGPSSVASGFEGRSDIALPPSPPPPMDEVDANDRADDLPSPIRSSSQAPAPQATSEQGRELTDRDYASRTGSQRETTQATGMDEDDDPWGDADAQWEAEQQSQEAQRNVSHPSAEPSAAAPSAAEAPSEAPAQKSEEQDAGEDWGWSDEPTHTAAAQQAATAAASGLTGSAPSVARRAIKPQKGRSSSPSGASPQLRQATRRSAEAAAAAAGLAGLGSGTGQAQGFTTRLTADALARNGDGAGVKSVDQQSSAASNAAVPSSKRRVESCKISKRSRELIKLAHRVLDDTIAIAESDAATEGEAPPPVPLLRSLADIFELYRALMPTLHYQTLTQIPSLAMQFANDCRFLSKEILLLNDRLEQSPALLRLLDTSPSVLDLPHEAAQMTSLGKQVFESQMASQASTLDELLTQTDSLLRVYQEERFALCSKVLAQLVHHLGALHRGWSEVLTPSSCAGALGTLVEAVLLRLGGDVLEIDDIGEREGERLAELIRLLVPLERLFPATSGRRSDTGPATTGEEQDAPASISSVASFVPSWVKITGYLPEILLGSLADVEFLLFEAGGLLLAPTEGAGAGASMGFTREEAKRLIRSTFADTPRRAALLGRVERGR